MSLTDLQLLFQFIGGLGLFLYGMHVMADGLQKSAGTKVRNLMGFLTKNRFVAVIVGALITVVIQSSSATTVMVVGFVNAGMLSLAQAVGVIMGANIGTTVTAWIVSLSEWGSAFKPEFFAPLVVGIGAFLLIFTSEEKVKKVGEILSGFGMLFIGLSFMSGAIAPYKEAKIFSDAFTVLGQNPLLAIVAGAVVTAVIQSSSASVGILQTLAMNGIVNWQSAVFITLGQNIGTCVTAVLSGMGASKNAKRASMIHLLFNLIGSVWAGILMYVLFRVNQAWAASTINSVEISVFHTVFNISNTVVMFPLGGFLVKMAEKLIPASGEEELEDTIVAEMERRLDHRILHNPSFAMETAEAEVLVMADITRANFILAMEAVEENSKEKSKKVVAMEQNINQLEKMLTAFLVEVDNLSLTEEQHLKIKNLFYTVSDIERIGDHSENISELANSKRKDKIQFSDKGEKDLKKIYEATLATLDASLEARRTGDASVVERVEVLEESVDELEQKYRDKHITRLSKGKCKPESSVIFLDLLSNLERVADHADNIGGYVLSEHNA